MVVMLIFMRMVVFVAKWIFLLPCEITTVKERDSP